MLRTASALAAGLLAVSLSACGAEDEPRTSERTFADLPESSTRAPETSGELGAPEQVYADWLAALGARDAAAACELQAPELTIALRQEAILVDRAELGDPCVGFEALLWEDPDFTSDVSDVEVTQATDEDALLAVTFNDGTEQTVRMVYHRAKWRVFEVDARTDDTETGSTDSGPARWVQTWCSLTSAMSREEIIAAMGEPSGEYTVSDGGEPQLWWAQDQYDFRVYLDVDGSVLELIGDYDALGEGDRAALACPELRQ